MKRGSEWVAGVCVLATTACGAKSLYAGSNADGGADYENVEGDSACNGIPCRGDVPEEFAGRWIGAAQNPPSDMVVEFLGWGPWDEASAGSGDGPVCLGEEDDSVCSDSAKWERLMRIGNATGVTPTGPLRVNSP